MKPRVDIAVAFDRCGSLFPNWKPTIATLESWQLSLSDIEPRALAVAVEQHVRTSKFAPTVAELRELAQGGPKSTELNPSDAWAEVMRWIRIGQYEANGRNPQPRWSHPAIERALGIFGDWQRLGAQLSTEVMSNRARFIEAVASYGRAAQREQQYLGADELVTALLANRSGMKQLYGADYVDPIEETSTLRSTQELDDIDQYRREVLEFDDPVFNDMGVAAESESA